MLRRAKVAELWRDGKPFGPIVLQRPTRFGTTVKSIVHDDARLVLFNQRDQFLGAPAFALTFRLTIVPPDDVDRPIAGHDFLYLPMQVVNIDRVITSFIFGSLNSRESKPCIGVGMVPVDHRVIGANFQAFGSSGIDDLFKQIASTSILCIELGQLAVV